MTDWLSDTHLSPAERELLSEAEAFAHAELSPLARRGRPGRVNRELLRALARGGLLGRLFASADEAGAAATAAIELCLIREGLARVCTEAETAFAVHGLGGFPILQAGCPDLVRQWAPRLASGEVTAGFALTEPEAGSDVASLALRAQPYGDGFRLSGEKVWISNAPEAEVYCVFARTTESAGARGITAFAVPRDSDGLTGEHLKLLAGHPIGRLVFDGVHVGPEQMLGERDRGFGVAMATLDLFRPSVGAAATGMAHAALQPAIAHAASRQAFGRPLKDFQAVSHRLADIATRVQASRLLVHAAARAYDEGLDTVTGAAAMAKLLATEMAQEAVDFAIQVHGARALQSGHLLEHLYREVRAPRIYEGSSEIQREIIARSLFSS